MNNVCTPTFNSHWRTRRAVNSRPLSNQQLLAIGDLNGDGVVNNADLQALLNLLKSGGGSAGAVPEPASLMLLAAGSLMLMLLRGRTLLARTAHNCENGHSD